MSNSSATSTLSPAPWVGTPLTSSPWRKKEITSLPRSGSTECTNESCSESRLPDGTSGGTGCRFSPSMEHVSETYGFLEISSTSKPDFGASAAELNHRNQSARSRQRTHRRSPRRVSLGRAPRPNEIDLPSGRDPDGRERSPVRHLPLGGMSSRTACSARPLDRTAHPFPSSAPHDCAHFNPRPRRQRHRRASRHVGALRRVFR